MNAALRLRLDRIRARPFPVLSGHFFRRLFQNDLAPFEDQTRQKLYILLAMLASFGWLLANALFIRYMFQADMGESWLETCQFLSFFMVLMALVTVLEWDVLFPDRRDYLNLGVLPIRTGTIFRAKFVSLVFFAAVFSAAVNALSVFSVAFYMPRWIDNSLATLVRYMAVHVVATTAAFLFAFLLGISLQAVLLVAAGPRLFRALSQAMRFALATGSLFLLLMFTADPAARDGFFAAIASLKAKSDLAVLGYPPMWFTGLYETLLGRTDPLYTLGAYAAVAGIGALILTYFAAMAIGYRRHLRKSLDVRSRAWPGRRLRVALSGAFGAIALRDPVERAIFQFTGRTLGRSAIHRVRLGGYLAAAGGFVLILLGARASARTDATPGNVGLLAIPIVLFFFLVLGLRNVVNVPLASEANWIFRLTADGPRRPYHRGGRKALLVFALLPLAAGIALGFGFAWGGGPALLHAGYGLAWGLILAEVLFWKFRRIPFACITVPGGSKLPTRWWAYVLGFSLGLSALSSLEKSLFGSPGLFAGFLGAAIALLALAEAFQGSFIYETLPLVFEEEPEPVMISL